VVFAAAALCFLAFFYFKNSDEVERARPIIILGSLVGLGILLYKYFDSNRGRKPDYRDYPSCRRCRDFNRNSARRHNCPKWVSISSMEALGQ
jgi:hypothetical protein